MMCTVFTQRLFLNGKHQYLFVNKLTINYVRYGRDQECTTINMRLHKAVAPE